MRLATIALLVVVAAAIDSAAGLPPGMRYIGCFADGGSRDLPLRAGTHAMTPTKCYRLCRDKKYGFFGVQYAKECWCGNSYGGFGRRPDSECNMRCTGDKSAFCGAGLRNNIYTTGVRRRSAPGTKRMRFIGCFRDSKHRDLPVLAGTHAMSPTKCNVLCRGKGYAYFGVQYARECWCGKSYGKHGRRPNGECNMHCTGDKSAFCGAGWRNNIYATGHQSGIQRRLKFSACYQSSTSWNGICRRAMDGDTNQNYFGHDSCTHTNHEKGYWHGSIRRRAHIARIRIFNRLDCCSNRLNNFVVTVDGHECASYKSNKFFKVKTFHCNRVGQNVIITNRQATHLTLCEVQIFGNYVRRHAARQDKLSLTACSQSSTSWEGACGRAIDGNTNPFYFGYSCTHTNHEMGWWQARTRKPAHIKKIRIVNRRDCCSERLNNFEITVDGHRCASYKSKQAFKVKTFTCNEVGQVVRIRTRQKVHLTLCEVQVFGEYTGH